MMVVPHDYVGSATAFAKAPGIGIEIICLNIQWLGGMALGKAKVASNVTHRGTGVVQEGNDMGPLIPQINIVPAPDNVLSIVHLLTSSCKVTFCRRRPSGGQACGLYLHAHAHDGLWEPPSKSHSATP